jgi:hypothetical protein
VAGASSYGGKRTTRVVLRALVSLKARVHAQDSSGLSDPYAEVSIRQRVGGAQLGRTTTKSDIIKTEVVKANLNPIWNEVFKISANLGRVDTSNLTVKVWDEDAVTDDFIGEARLELAQVLAQPNCCLEAELALVKRNGEPVAGVKGSDRPRVLITVKLDFGEVVREHIVKEKRARWFQKTGIERDYKIAEYLGLPLSHRTSFAALSPLFANQS